MAGSGYSLRWNNPPRRWANLLRIDETEEGSWGPEEMEAIFQHQWTVPILLPLRRDGTRVMPPPTPGVPPPIASCHDLFTHPHPPLGMLMIIMKWGRQHQTHPESQLPRELSAVLYLAPIFAALVRLDRRIAPLSDQALRCAEWLVDQPWLDAPTKQLFQEGLDKLKPKPRRPRKTRRK